MLSWLVALLGVIRLLAVIRPSQAESALCAYGLQLAWLCVEVPLAHAHPTRLKCPNLSSF